MKIIVLSINNYKEKDAIITAISQSETITFLARGIKDPKSKNAAINNPLMIADIELMVIHSSRCSLTLPLFPRFAPLRSAAGLSWSVSLSVVLAAAVPQLPSRV